MDELINMKAVTNDFIAAGFKLEQAKLLAEEALKYKSTIADLSSEEFSNSLLDSMSRSNEIIRDTNEILEKMKSKL